MEDTSNTRNQMTDSPERPGDTRALAGEESVSEPAGPGDQPVEIQPRRVVEAILMASDTPLPAAKIASILGVGTAGKVREHVEALNKQYKSQGMSFRIEHIAGGYQILTLPAYNHWLAKLIHTRQETRLSPAALETLAIVAYKQPCTRAEIEAIRGVAVGERLQKLREMNLAKIVGRAEDLGRPMLYGTTKHFLKTFGLASLEDLPQVEALKRAAPSATAEEPSASEKTDTRQEVSTAEAGHKEGTVQVTAGSPSTAPPLSDPNSPLGETPDEEDPAPNLTIVREEEAPP